MGCLRCLHDRWQVGRVERVLEWGCVRRATRNAHAKDTLLGHLSQVVSDIVSFRRTRRVGTAFHEVHGTLSAGIPMRPSLRCHPPFACSRRCWPWGLRVRFAKKSNFELRFASSRLRVFVFFFFSRLRLFAFRRWWRRSPRLHSASSWMLWCETGGR